MLNTDNWYEIPFSVEGVNFVSKIDPQGSFYPMIKRLPAGIFEAQHKEMVAELIGNPALMTREELQNELDNVNLGASQALLALA